MEEAGGEVAKGAEEWLGYSAEEAKEWQRRQNPKRLPQRAKTAKEKEVSLAKRLAKLLAAAEHQEVSEEGLAVLRELPGVADLLTPKSTAEQLAADIVAWQQKAGVERWPTEGAEASPQERKLAQRGAAS